MVGSGEAAPYQGETFSGTPVGQTPQPVQVPSQAPGEHEERERSKPRSGNYCPDCNSKVVRVSGGAFWCSVCRKMARSNRKPNSVFGLFILCAVVLVPLVLGAFYFNGSFDHRLAADGLNWQPCRERYDGPALCGDELPAGAGVQNGVQDWFRHLY